MRSPAIPLVDPRAGPIRWPRCGTVSSRCGSAAESGDQLAKDDAHRAFHAAIVALAGNRQLDLAMEPILLKLQRPMAENLRCEASRSDRTGAAAPRAVARRSGDRRRGGCLMALRTSTESAVSSQWRPRRGRPPTAASLKPCVAHC